MAAGDERSGKTTAEFDRDDLEKLAARSVRAPTDPGELLTDAQLAKGSERPHRGNEHRPTSKLHKDELLGLLNLATVVAPAPEDEVVSLDTEDRKTQRMRAKQFQQLLRNGQATMPITPELLQSIDWHADADAAADHDLAIPRDPETILAELMAQGRPGTESPIHEEVASSGLLAAALAEMKATGLDARRLASPTIDVTSEMLAESAARRASSETVTPAMLVASRAPPSATLPLEPALLAEITATAPPPEKRPAVEMRPIERPQAATSPPIELTVRKQVIELKPRMPETAEPRSDVGLMIVVSLIVLAIVMTLTWLVIF